MTERTAEHERKLATQRRYKARHRDKERGWALARYHRMTAGTAEEAARVAVLVANRRALRMGVPGVLADADVLALWERQPACVRCGQGRGLDHVVPMFRGGANSPDNLQNLCRSCNVAKGRKVQAAA